MNKHFPSKKKKKKKKKNDGQAMLPECLMNVCQRTTSRKTLPWWSKTPLKTSTYQKSRGNRLHRIEQSGEAS